MTFHSHQSAFNIFVFDERFLRVFSYKFRVNALLVEAEFDNVIDTLRSGIDAIHFTATGLSTSFIVVLLLPFKILILC